jgi:hypothetical protein
MLTDRDCTRAVDSALSWIVAHLDEFDPFHGGGLFEIKNGQKVGELAILLQAYVAATGDRNGAAPRRLIALLESVSANRQFRERLLRSPAEFILFAEVYAALRDVGCDDPGRRAQLEAALAAGLLEHNERLPHRMMDVASCLQAGNFDHPWPSLSELYACSILGRIPSPLFLNEDGLYALTHVIMFRYRFGSRPMCIPPHQVEPLQALLSTLLVVIAQESHWDLLAELLLCWEAIGYPATVTSERAWETLLSHQDGEGAIPGPQWAVPLYAAAEELGKLKREDAYFSHHYHTTLVSIIALCLKRRNLRQGRPALAAVSPAAPRRRRVQPASAALAPAAATTATATAAAAAARSAARWLDGLAATVCRDPEARRDTLCRLLLGCHVAAAVAPNAGPARGSSRPALRRIAARLRGRPATAPDSYQDVPPLLALAAAGALDAAGLRAPSLNGPGGWVARAAELLAAVPATDPLADLPLADKRALLNGMGLHPAPGGIAVAELVSCARALPPAMPAEALEQLLAHAGSLTGWGTRQVDLGDDGPWLEELMAATALRLLRGYDLVHAARILRAMIHLGLRGSAWRQGIDYLLLQQRPEGSFGLFAAEEHKILRARPDFQPAVDLQLLPTVECLWTLAECGGWRLLDSLRPPAPGRRAGRTARGEDSPSPAAPRVPLTAFRSSGRGCSARCP